jgi:hypothetical protein
LRLALFFRFIFIQSAKNEELLLALALDFSFFLFRATSDRAMTTTDNMQQADNTTRTVSEAPSAVPNAPRFTHHTCDGAAIQ